MPIRLPSTRPRRAGGVLFVLAVVAVLAELAGLGYRTSQLNASTAAPTPTALTAVPSPTTTSLPPPTTSSTTAPAPATTSTTVRPRPTTTTVAPIGPPVLGQGSVTYTVPAATVLTVAAITNCWVEARAGADGNGQILSQQTLGAGKSETFPAPVWLRFGNPAAVKVTAGTVLLVLPVGPGNLVVNSP